MIWVLKFKDRDLPLINLANLFLLTKVSDNLSRIDRRIYKLKAPRLEIRKSVMVESRVVKLDHLIREPLKTKIMVPWLSNKSRFKQWVLEEELALCQVLQACPLWAQLYPKITKLLANRESQWLELKWKEIAMLIFKEIVLRNEGIHRIFCPLSMRMPKSKISRSIHQFLVIMIIKIRSLYHTLLDRRLVLISS